MLLLRRSRCQPTDFPLLYARLQVPERGPVRAIRPAHRAIGLRPQRASRSLCMVATMAECRAAATTEHLAHRKTRRGGIPEGKCRIKHFNSRYASEIDKNVFIMTHHTRCRVLHCNCAYLRMSRSHHSSSSIQSLLRHYNFQVGEEMVASKTRCLHPSSKRTEQHKILRQQTRMGIIETVAYQTR